MRSVVPMPGNPWPHDMVIRVEDRPHTLLELLWAREAYSLDVGADIPRLVLTPTSVVTDAASRAEWTTRWPAVWQAALTHAADAVRLDPSAISDSPPASAERASLLAAAMGPTWSSEVGPDALEAPERRQWTSRLPWPEHARRLEDHPERRDLAALIPAWEAGLTTIVSLPVAGALGRRAGEHGLLVSDQTRADSAAYRRALAAF